MLWRSVSRIYIWDDLVSFLNKRQLLFISVFVRSFLFACFLGYFFVVSFPSIWTILRNQSIATETSFWKKQSSIVVAELNQVLQKLKDVKSKVGHRMGTNETVVGVDVFNTVLGILKDSGIGSVFIKIGKSSYSADAGDVLIIPVEIKMCTEYGNLLRFFERLHSCLAFRVEYLDISRGVSAVQQRIRLKLNVFVNHMPLSELIERLQNE